MAIVYRALIFVCLFVFDSVAQAKATVLAALYIDFDFGFGFDFCFWI